MCITHQFQYCIFFCVFYALSFKETNLYYPNPFLYPILFLILFLQFLEDISSAPYKISLNSQEYAVLKTDSGILA